MKKIKALDSCVGFCAVFVKVARNLKTDAALMLVASRGCCKADKNYSLQRVRGEIIWMVCR